MCLFSQYGWLDAVQVTGNLRFLPRDETVENPDLELGRGAGGGGGGGCLLALRAFFFSNNGGPPGPSRRSANVRCRDGGYDRRTVQAVIISFFS